MKPRTTISCAIFLALIAIPPEASAAGGTLREVVGKVWLSQPGHKERTTLSGAKIAEGTTVRTGKEARAEIILDDGSILRLRPNTSMKLSSSKRTQKKKTSLVLFFGRLWNKVIRGRNTDFRVNTPNAVAGVRGTEFETAVADDGSLRVRVSEGQVDVGDTGRQAPVKADQEIEANEQGVGKVGSSQPNAQWAQWRQEKQKRLRTQTRDIVGGVKKRIMSRKEKIEDLRRAQKSIEQKRSRAEKRSRMGDRKALEEVKRYNHELATIADEIADLGDEAESQFGIIDHFADLAGDPRFAGIDRKYLEAEAKSLRKIKALFDKMVQEGTDVSIEAMDKMLDNMGKGNRDTLRDKKGSSVEDLFGDDMDMR